MLTEQEIRIKNEMDEFMKRGTDGMFSSNFRNRNHNAKLLSAHPITLQNLLRSYAPQQLKANHPLF